MAQEHPAIKHIITKHFDDPNLHKLETYKKYDGYKALEKVLSMSPDDVIAEVKKSGLRGRGGAGFPTGVKWDFVPKNAPAPHYLVCNFDEGEPGTSKDRYLIENNPHQLIEGCLIGAYAIRANHVLIYVRGEYDLQTERIMNALQEARAAGYVGNNILNSGFSCEFIVFRGAGAYICGEETALLESLEGKRAQPRSRPPFPATFGAFGKPSAINNAETLSTVPQIILNGGEWYASFGTEKSPGTRLFAITGNVQRPGVYEVELGTPLEVLVNEIAGGPPPGRKVKMIFPGGSSTPVLPASDIDVHMDFESVAARGSIFGSGAVIVVDDSWCTLEVAKRLVEFYEHESCGKCTPCRIGCNWLSKVYDRIMAGYGVKEDLELLDKIANGMAGKCLCALGDGCAAVVSSTLKHFREEYEEHILDHKCSVKLAQSV